MSPPPSLVRLLNFHEGYADSYEALWSAWMRNTRIDPPTEEEQLVEQQRQLSLQTNVARLAEEYKAEKLRMAESTSEAKEIEASPAQDAERGPVHTVEDSKAQQKESDAELARARQHMRRCASIGRRGGPMIPAQNYAQHRSKTIDRQRWADRATNRYRGSRKVHEGDDPEPLRFRSSFDCASLGSVPLYLRTTVSSSATLFFLPTTFVSPLLDLWITSARCSTLLAFRFRSHLTLITARIAPYTPS